MNADPPGIAGSPPDRPTDPANPPGRQPPGLETHAARQAAASPHADRDGVRLASSREKRSRRTGLEARTWGRFGIAAVALALAWAVLGAVPFLIAGRLPAVDLDRVSSFGQTFQVAESFFSALSVAGVAYALVLQARDQADARHQATRARQQSAASEANSVELALLASLVQARAALVRTSQAAHEEAQGLPLDPGDQESRDAGPSEAVKQLAKIRRDQLAELLALVNYVERVSGWAEKKATHYPTPAHGDEVPDQPPLFRPQGDDHAA